MLGLRLAVLSENQITKKLQTMNSISDLIRKYFAAYDSKDRKSLESLLRDDFTFSSPLDDNISREQYLERCWPNSEHQSGLRIKTLFAEGNEAFVTYECEKTDGNRFHNTEFFTSDGERFKHVDVYFGREIGDVNGNGAVNASDFALTKSQSGQAVTAANFREDVNANGSINAADVALVKSLAGTGLP